MKLYNLSFGTNRSLCADFYLINDGPQNMCAINIYQVKNVFHDQKSLGSAGVEDCYFESNIAK